MNRRKSRVVLCLLLLTGLWFIAVDWSWFVHDCPDCGHESDVMQYRVFTIPVHESIAESHSLIQRLATDLGVPCQHRNAQRWHKHRLWGLCFCKSPCINGTYRMNDGESWYDRSHSTKVARLAAAEPAVAVEFSRRVLVEHDFTYAQEILEKAGIDPSNTENRAAR